MDIREFARMGGKARAAKLSLEERREISRRGGLANKGKKRGPYKKKRKKGKRRKEN